MSQYNLNIHLFCSFIVLTFVKSERDEKMNLGKFSGADWYYTTYYTHPGECYKHQTRITDSELMRMNSNVST